MTESVTIVELSHAKANKKVSNAEFETILKSPVKVSDGSFVTLKSGFINTKSLSSDIIILDRDTEIIMRFGFYYINGAQFATPQANGNPQWNGVAIEYNGGQIGQGTPQFRLNNIGAQTNYDVDYRYYYLMEYPGPGAENGRRLTIKEHRFTIPKGQYTPSFLANYITQKCGRINGRDFNTPPSTVPNYNAQSDGMDFLGTSTPFLLNITPTLAKLNNAYSFYPYGYPNSFALYQENDFGTDSADTYNFFLSIDANGDPAVGNILIGTSEVALDYDPDSQLFYWSYFHTPYYYVSGNPATSTLSTIITRPQEGAPIKTQTKSGGIFFTALEPVSFWRDTLGFDMNDIVVDVSTGIMDADVIRCTTDQEFSMSNLLVSNNNSLVCKFPMTYANGATSYPAFIYASTSNNIVPIYARSVYRTLTSGYYLIKIDMGLSGNFNDGEHIISDIFAVASKQWVNNDYLSIFGDSAISYQHHGEPVIVSSIKVTVLDQNMNPVTNIGTNNSFFLEFVNASGASAPQPESKLQPAPALNK